LNRKSLDDDDEDGELKDAGQTNSKVTAAAIV